jgi:hypothetical protein
MEASTNVNFWWPDRWAGDNLLATTSWTKVAMKSMAVIIG